MKIQLANDKYKQSSDLTNQTQGDPLVVGVVHLIIALPLPGTVALKPFWDVEG